MKFSLAVAVLLTSALSPAWAGELVLHTQVESATVYPTGADVWRVGVIDLPLGETRLLLSDLPASIDPRSIRVEAEGSDGLIINDVDTKLEQLPSSAIDEKRRELQLKMQALSDERQALDQTIADAQAQKTLLMSLANKQLTPSSSSETLKPIDAASLDGLVSLVGSKLEAISKIVHDAKLKQRQIDLDVGDLNVAISGLAPAEQAKLNVAIDVQSSVAAHAQFKIKYRVEGAGWSAFYDAKLTLPENSKPASMMLVQRADVHQASSENWDAVKLTLSTARPSGASTAPELGEDPLDLSPPVGRAIGDVAGAPASVKLKKDQLAAAPALDETEAADKPAKEAQAQVMVAGFNAQYVIGGRVSIDNSDQAKKVQIGNRNPEVKLADVAVPRLDPRAYLTASFVVDGADPLLPGIVNLYRDDVYVGQGVVLQLAAGENAKLGFGADDLINVKRVEVKRNSADEGILTTRSTRTLAWDISVKNLHDTSFPVMLIDRIPFSTQNIVTIELTSDSTPATADNYDLKRGVKAWTLNLDPKAEKTIRLGYKIVAPKDVSLPLTE